jgi:hypothetical protein
MIASLRLRGKAVPADMEFYANAISLLLFLLLRLPGLRQRVDFSRPTGDEDKATMGGLASLVAGTAVLTTELWVGASHIAGSSNWVHVLRLPLMACGALLTGGGLALLLWASWDALSLRNRLGSSQLQ